MNRTMKSRKLVGAMLVFGMLAARDGFSQVPAAAEVKKAQGRVPPFYQTAEDGKPFPPTLPPEMFEKPAVARAYQVAKEIPAVLAQQPCYCSCDRIGHRSLLDCFASRHAESCLICTNEAILADRMTRAKKTPREIREAIIRGDWRLVK